MPADLCRVFPGHDARLHLLMTHNSVQIAHDAFGIAVSQKNLAVQSLDVDNLVAPHVGSHVADAANAVATQRVPGFSAIALDLLPWYRAQAKTEGANLDAVAEKTVLESAPGSGDSCKSDQADQGHRKAQGRNAHQGGDKSGDDYKRQNKQDKESSGMRFFRQKIVFRVPARRRPTR